MKLSGLEILLKESVSGIELCLKARLFNSALILFYCGIDTASSLDLEHDKSSVRLRYTKWCDTYLFKRKSYICTSLEIYAARCGAIHETSVESDLSKYGKTRRIIYAWGDSNVDTLREMNELAEIKDYVAVQFEDLVCAYRGGLDVFLETLRGSEERANYALKKAEKCLGQVSNEEILSLLEWGKAQLGRRI